MENGLVFGLKCGELLGSYDHNLQSLKMSGCLPSEGFQQSLEILPKSGMMRNGRIYEQATWVRRTGENGFGLWRTPAGSDGEGGIMKMHKDKAGHYKLRDQVQEINKKFWPTPNCVDVYTDKLKSSQQKSNSMHSVTLAQAVQKWPSVSDAKTAKGCTQEYINRRKKNGRLSKVSEIVADGNIQDGQLNPTWVEWLMGYPLGHTDLNA